MGDMADMALEETYDFEEVMFDFRRGGMSSAEAYERGIVDELGYEIIHSGTSENKICKYCGKSGLSWGSSAGKFHLGSYKSNKFVVHTCPKSSMVKKCRFCGETGLVWGKVWDPHAKKNNWRLFKGDVIHICSHKNK